MSFPAPGCNEQIIDDAAEKFKDSERELTYDPSWVCVSRTQAKYDQDALAQWRNTPPSSALPLFDASTGPAQSAPEEPNDELAQRAREERQAFDSPDEWMLRAKLERPFVADRAQLGIALSGGGSKAAAFGSGVLSGLADSELLDSAAYISTVSGGSYAAYFYYAHKIIPAVRRGETPPTSLNLYNDCIRYPVAVDAEPSQALAMSPEPPSATLEVLQEIYQAGGCTVDELFPRQWRNDPKSETIKYQAFVRCQQDVLNPGKCSIERRTEDYGVPVSAIVINLMSAPPSWIANTLFDWGLITSSTAVSYEQGIGMAYGANITDLGPIMQFGDPDSPKTIRVECPTTLEKNHPFAEDCVSGLFDVAPQPLTYAELRKGLLKAKTDGKPMPFWIINAVAPESRSSFGWWSQAGKFNTTSSDIFEMTPVSHGSGRYGYVSASMALHGFTLLDSVAASAAFFDPTQNVDGGPWRGLLGMGQRIINLDWGIDISNYNVTDARRVLHMAMPFPVLDSPLSRYILHRGQPQEDQNRVRSVFIRLIDGGNGDNLGLYSLLKRGAKNIVISDAAQDIDGKFSDLCEVQRRLSYVPAGIGIPNHLYIPGLRDFENHCNDDAQKDFGYGVHNWAFDFPVLLGCVRTDERTDDPKTACNDLGKDDVRLFIIKPAVNAENFQTEQMENYHYSDTLDRKRITACTLPGGAHEVEKEPLNCETTVFMLDNWSKERGYCQVFPQHTTAGVTSNSSHLIYAAYRELARQYTARAGKLIAGLSRADDKDAREEFEQLVMRQFDSGFFASGKPCDPEQWKPSPWAKENTPSDSGQDNPAVNPVQ
jgi:hypothetical protein